MNNLDRRGPSQRFLNLFGGSVDENAERERIYNEAKQTWPVDLKYSDCEHLQILINAIQRAIDGSMQIKANDPNGGGRVQNRYIDAYTRYRDELKVLYDSRKCEETKKKEEEKAFFDTQYSNLERVKGLSEDAGNTSKYLIFGMLGLVVIVSGIIILKKE